MSSYRQPYQILLYCCHIDSAGNINWLLLKRTPARGGFWQGITGAALKDEPLIDAARREMLEETGISLNNIIETSIHYTITVRPEWAAKYNFHPDQEFITEDVFIAHLSPADKPVLSDEHTDWGWYSLDQAVSILYWPKNIDALKKCHSIVSNNVNPDMES